MKHIHTALILTLMAGCGQVGTTFDRLTKPDRSTAQASPPAAAPLATRRPPPAARTVEQFDTSTTAERTAALAAPKPAGSGALGRTVASLGDPAQPGFWLKTPLVKQAGKGRIAYGKTGRTVQVDLIPLEGATSAGSQISLAAMRLLNVALTDLPEIEVFAQ
jgi:hypothetical protein